MSSHKHSLQWMVVLCLSCHHHITNSTASLLTMSGMSQFVICLSCGKDFTGKPCRFQGHMSKCRDNDLNNNKNGKRSHLDSLAQQLGQRHDSGTFPWSFTYKKMDKGPKDPEKDDVDFSVGTTSVPKTFCQDPSGLVGGYEDHCGPNNTFVNNGFVGSASEDSAAPKADISNMSHSKTQPQYKHPVDNVPEATKPVFTRDAAPPLCFNFRQSWEPCWISKGETLQFSTSQLSYWRNTWMGISCISQHKL